MGGAVDNLRAIIASRLFLLAVRVSPASEKPFMMKALSSYLPGAVNRALDASSEEPASTLVEDKRDFYASIVSSINTPAGYKRSDLHAICLRVVDDAMSERPEIFAARHDLDSAGRYEHIRSRLTYLIRRRDEMIAA